MSAAPSGSEMWATLAVVGAAAGVALLAASQPRMSAGGADVSGAHTPAATALSLVALVALAAVILLPARGRRALAVLLVLAGVGIVAAMLSRPTAATWIGYGQGPFAVERSAWAWTGAGAGVAVAVASGWMLARAPRWPRPAQMTAYGGRRRADQAPRSRSTWDALDAGEDPTVGA